MPYGGPTDPSLKLPDPNYPFKKLIKVAGQRFHKFESEAEESRKREILTSNIG